MRYSLPILLLILLLHASQLHSQPGTASGAKGGPPCGFDIVTEQLYRSDPAMREHARGVDMSIYHMLDHAGGKLPLERMPDGSAAYVIPVVVHIIHNGGSENISDDDVRAGIANLNAAYANVGEFDSTTGVAVGIQFCLARRDPRGKASSGITRRQSVLTDMILENDDVAVKDLDRWDPKSYLNIWVVRSLVSIAIGPSISGYAYSPASHGSPRDGVLVEANLINTGIDPIKILVHEVGHYLGLYHTFQGGCENNDCLIDGDQVCDTPPDASAAETPCDVDVNTCTTDTDDHSVNNPFRPVALGGLGDQYDMVSNYMDYGLQQCKSAFTRGQRDRMIAAVTIARASLLISKGCADPCTSDITAFFTPGDQVIVAGTTLFFVNQSTGATGYEWTINGALLSTTPNVAYQFNTKGTYKITLKAYNTDSTCTREYTVTIKVKCPMDLSFTVDRTNIQPGEAVKFKYIGSGATSYLWFVDGEYVGQGDSITYAFGSDGTYQVYLIGNNGTCFDTSLATVIHVGNCRGTKEDAVWYFGHYAGLDFRHGPPVSLDDGNMNTHEGSASIADRDGNLLFYSDAVNVWGRDHNPMQNGAGLKGSGYAAQGCTIVKAPGSDSLYYLFTTGNWKDPDAGLHYSVVDMSLNNGLGAVTDQKNILLKWDVSERVAAVYHTNCLDVWIVVHEEESNTFLAYLLTRDGVATNPVITDIGPVERGTNRYGTLKFSQNGKYLASVFGGTSTAPTVVLYDFDAGTGVVSNEKAITAPNDIMGAYAGEFSPNNRFLYVTAINGSFVYQYDITAGTGPQIRDTKVDVSAGNDRRLGLQLGPDGKIYVTLNNSPYLDVINVPNNKGTACQYRKKLVDLDGNNASMLLPASVAGYTVKTISIDGDTSACMRHPATYTAQGGWCSRGSYIWRVTGPARITKITGIDITLDFIDSGTVTLYLDNQNTCGSLLDTMTVAVRYAPPLGLGPDTAVCNVGIDLDAGPGFASYLWQDGSTGSTLKAIATGRYWVSATAPSGCIYSDTVNVTVASPVSHVDLGRDSVVCSGDVVTLDAGPDFRSYLWQDGSDLRKFTAYLPGRYWVTVESYCGDILTDTIQIAANQNQLVNLGPDVSVCYGDTVVLDAGTAGTIRQWSTGATTQTITVLDTGTYWVYVSNGHCESRDTINVVPGRNNSYMVWLPDMAAQGAVPLDTFVVLPLRIRGIAGRTVIRGLRYSGTLRFNRSVLIPYGPPDVAIKGNERLVSFSGIAGTSDTLALFTFRTVLGDVDTVAIAIDDIRLGDPCLKDVAVGQGSVAITVCRANGSPRLIGAGGLFALAVPNPNPTGAGTEIRYSLVEHGLTRLQVVDMYGVPVRTLSESIADPGSYSTTVDTRDLPSGLYFITLDTPTQRAVQQLMVER